MSGQLCRSPFTQISSSAMMSLKLPLSTVASSCGQDYWWEKRSVLWHFDGKWSFPLQGRLVQASLQRFSTDANILCGWSQASLLRTYVAIDKRFPQLLGLVKNWAKARGQFNTYHFQTPVQVYLSLIIGLHRHKWCFAKHSEFVCLHIADNTGLKLDAVFSFYKSWISVNNTKLFLMPTFTEPKCREFVSQSFFKLVPLPYSLRFKKSPCFTMATAFHCQCQLQNLEMLKYVILGRTLRPCETFMPS